MSSPAAVGPNQAPPDTSSNTDPAALRRRLLILSRCMVPLLRASLTRSQEEARSAGDKRRASRLSTSLLLLPLAGKVGAMFAGMVRGASDRALTRSLASMLSMLSDAGNSALTDEDWGAACVDEIERAAGPAEAATFAEILADAVSGRDDN